MGIDSPFLIKLQVHLHWLKLKNSKISALSLYLRGKREAEREDLMDRSQLRLRLSLTNTNILLHVVPPRQDTIQANITNADTDMQVIVIGDDEGQEDIHVHEDLLIEEKGDEVFIANPTLTLPWWKQRRTKIVLGVMLGIVGSWGQYQ